MSKKWKGYICNTFDFWAVCIVLFSLPHSFYYNNRNILSLGMGWRVLYFAIALFYSFVCLFGPYAIDVCRYLAKKLRPLLLGSV